MKITGTKVRAMGYFQGGRIALFTVSPAHATFNLKLIITLYIQAEELINPLMTANVLQFVQEDRAAINAGDSFTESSSPASVSASTRCSTQRRPASIHNVRICSDEGSAPGCLLWPGALFIQQICSLRHSSDQSISIYTSSPSIRTG